MESQEITEAMEFPEVVDSDLSPVERARKKHREAIACHEREISQRKQDIIEEKRYLNRLFPVSRLVPEILSVIFAYVAHDHPPYRQRYSWIRNITHVCHDWREIALHAPRVWNRVRLTDNKDLMREIAARSKEAPLHIATDEPLQKMWHLALILKHLRRIHTMKLTLAHAMADPKIPSPFLAPELRRLELTAGPDWHASTSLFFEGCMMPKLTHLELRSEKLRVPWSSPMFQRSLTHLVLMNRVPTASTLKATLKALDSMPYLKSVSMVRVIPTQIDGASQVVHLGHLESLHLIDSCSSCTALLQRISYPSSAALSLEINSYSDDELATLGREITTKLLGFDSLDVGIRSLAIKAFRHPVGITAWRVDVSADQMGKKLQAKGYPDLIFDLALRPGNDPEFSLARFRSPLPLSNVQTLYLEAGALSLDSSWRKLSATMPDITNLVISSDQRSDQQIAHLLTIPMTLGEPASPPLFPSAHSLMLLGTRFRPDSSRYTKSDIRSDLRKMLISRRLAGRMIRKLYFDDAVNLYDADLVGIRKEVQTLGSYWDNVSWDGPDG